jgi:hypothetical protein
MLTRKQKRQYLRRGGTHCPKCNGSIEGGGLNFDGGYISQEISCHGSIEGGGLNFDGGYISQEISCLECGAAWWDVYKLVDIEDRET